jgi:RHS repeat-associated protein
VRTAYELDPVTEMPVVVFDPADREATEIRTAYDAHRNPLRVEYPDGKAVAFEYDAHGRRIATTDVAGNTTTLDTTPAGLLAAAVQVDEAGDTIAEVAYAYDVFGRATTVRRGNGVTTEHTFTSTSQIATETSTDRDGHVVSDRAYEYDPRDNLSSRTDRVHPAGGVPETTVTEYTYDAYDRLTGSSTRTDDRVAGRTGYDLSVSGDIRSETVTTDVGAADEVSTEREYEYGPTGELVAMLSRVDAGAAERQEQTYDAAGNLTVAFDGTRYEYDARNRPVTEAAADGATIATDYWADGSRRRHSIASGDATTVTEFYWDGATLINDVHTVDDAGAVDAAATGTAAYLIAGPRLARITDDAAGEVVSTWYGTDRHGNIAELLTADGRLAGRYAYTDYGVGEFTPVDPEAPAVRDGLARNPFGYAGEYTDRRGTQHLHTRTYDPEMHRFTTLDVEDLHNLYAFADLNPITKVDPTGRNGEFDWVMGLNLALFVASAVLTAFNVGTIAVAAVLAVRAATLIGGAAPVAVEGVKLSTWALLGFGLFMDLGSTAVSGVQVYDDHFEPILGDERVKTGVAVLEGAAALGAAVITGFVIKSLVKTARSLPKATATQGELAQDQYVKRLDAISQTVKDYFVATSERQSSSALYTHGLFQAEYSTYRAKLTNPARHGNLEHESSALRSHASLLRNATRGKVGAETDGEIALATEADKALESLPGLVDEIKGWSIGIKR